MQHPSFSLRFLLQLVFVEFLVIGGLNLATDAPAWLYFAIAVAAFIVLLLIQKSRLRWLLDWSWLGEDAQAQRRRDKTFKHAMRYVAVGNWPNEGDHSIGGNPEDLKRLAEQIWQQAIDGRITIWGRRARNNIHVPIPRDYLVSKPVSVTKHVINMPSLDATLKAMLGEADPPSDDYIDLMVSKVEIEAIWPPKK